MSRVTYTQKQFDDLQKKKIAQRMRAKAIPKKRKVKTYSSMKAYRSDLCTRVEVAPLSVNECWQGKRFKTKTYSDYERELIKSLPDITIPQTPYHVHYKFGFSNRNCDLLNPEKPFTDVICKRYGINDKHIFKMTLERDHVVKGCEYIEFSITNLKS